MHPEVRQDHPGNCPKCGMALEPLMPSLDDDENPELRDFQRRFWWTLPLTAIVFVLACWAIAWG
jgi:Cu+-exporting ATPase